MMVFCDCAGVQDVAYYTAMLVAAASVNASTGLYNNLTRFSFSETNAQLRSHLASEIELHNDILTGHPPQLPHQVYLFYDQQFPVQRLYGSVPHVVNQTFVDMVAGYVAGGALILVLW